MRDTVNDVPGSCRGSGQRPDVIQRNVSEVNIDDTQRHNHLRRQTDGKIAVAGDGQVTMGESTIFKATAHKVRRIFGGKVVTGFAGTVSDAFALCDRFEAKLEQFSGNLERAAVELAQEWRSDKAMRKLEAMLIVASGETLMIVSGTGEVIEPDDGIAAVGSGGNYAMAAARALKENTDLSAHEIAEKALHIAADICVFTNHNVIVEDA